MIEWIVRIGVAMILLGLAVWLLVLRQQVKDEEAKTEARPPDEHDP